MLNIKLLDQIKQNFFNKPTSGQELTMNLFVDFLLSSQPDTVFLLKGYAGTGKTSLVSALVRTLDGMKQKCILLAPTGRYIAGSYGAGGQSIRASLRTSGLHHPPAYLPPAYLFERDG